MRLDFAPMEGVTSYLFRRVHARLFPGADRYYAPFIAPDSRGSFKASALRDLLPENNPGLHLVPQILCNHAQAFLLASAQLEQLGYREVNLNAGCPSATVVTKHKGAGLLLDLDSLSACLDGIFAACPLRVSVKTRLGLESAEEFAALLDVYRRYPLSELIVHARPRSAMYRGVPDRAAFALALQTAPFPVTYNGDIFSHAALASLEAELPGVTGVMIGRGAAADPALFRLLRGGAPLGLAEFAAFHDALLDAFLSSGLSAHFALSRLKELWYYWRCLFPSAAREVKAVLKARDLPSYRSAVAALFSSGGFDPLSFFPGTP